MSTSKADISKTPVLLKMFDTPRENRQAEWVKNFVELVTVAPLEIGNPQIIRGPDGFPYFSLKFPTKEGRFAGACLHDVLEHITTNGVGVVITSARQQPEWVFSLGEFVCMREFGALRTDAPFDVPLSPPKGTEAAGGDQTDVAVVVANPGPKMLPPYLRRHLAGYIKNRFGVDAPGVILLRNDKASPSTYLVFTVFEEDFNNFDDYRDAMKTLHWFLPQHYVVGALPKSAVPRDRYFALHV